MQKKIAIYLKFIFKLMFLCSIFGNLNSRIQNVTSRVENLLIQRAVCRFLLSCISLRIIPANPLLPFFNHDYILYITTFFPFALSYS